MKNERESYIDAIRGFAIVLVIVGHLLEKLCLSGNGLYCFYFKFVYSFHVPLFVFLAGVYHKKGVIRWKLIYYYWGFAVMAIPFWITAGKELGFILEGLISTFLGYPSLNWVSWFFLMLLMIEIMAKAVEKFSRNNMRIAIFSSILISILSITSNSGQDLPFFMGQAAALLPFYLAGHLLRNVFVGGRMIFKNNREILIVGGVLIMVALNAEKAVVVAISQYGNVILFFVSGGLGVVGILGLLQRMTKFTDMMGNVGRWSKVFMFYAGIQFHFVDSYLLGIIFLLLKKMGGVFFKTVR